MPALLRDLLEAELAAGNAIAEIGHSFPAPPSGAYFLLTQPLLTRAPASGDGIVYYDRQGSAYSGEITDANRSYFLLEPPHAPEPIPDMNAVREARGARADAEERASGSATASMKPSASTSSASETGVAAGLSLLQRFERSMILDYEKWHDGVGYDLEALREMAPAELESAQIELLRRGIRDWRDVEACACINSSVTQAALRAAMNDPNPEVRNAVARYAPQLVTDGTRVASLVHALQTARFFGGLRQTLELVTDFHPPPIVDALLRGALEREGQVAVHFAAMLSFIHGQAREPFDWAQRPFFLRFNTDNRRDRETAFRALCTQIGVDPERFLPAPGSAAPGSS